MRSFGWVLGGGIASAQEFKVAAAESAGPSYSIGAAKLIVEDAETSKSFFETYFGMKEIRSYDTETCHEPIMGYEQGARLALFAATTSENLKRGAYPVALVYTPDVESMTKRMEDAGFPIRHLPAAQSGTYHIAIANDPSGNVIEIISGPDKPAEVGASKLIVADREKAEAWFTNVFGVKPTRRIQTVTYDEVLLGFRDGAFLASFQPLQEDLLSKSRYPVVAIYTSDYEAVKARVDEAELGSRHLGSDTTRVDIAQDPSGNAVEIIGR